MLNYGGLKSSGSTATDLAEDLQFLKKLYVTDNDLSPLDGVALAKGLQNNNTLTHIDFRSNNLGGVGGAALAEALKRNHTLTNLYLGHNNLGDVGGAALAEALKINRTLTKLAISNNNLGDVGGAALAEALKSNRTLTIFYLGSNKLSDAGGLALVEALKINRKLTILDVKYNNIDFRVEAKIREAIERNVTIRDIGFWKPNNHIRFPPRCHTNMFCTLMAANRFDVRMPPEIWEYIFSMLRYKNFLN
jgi:Ran GTPase-activating protein (RanGAP) involved in mRNA processing and transport